VNKTTWLFWSLLIGLTLTSIWCNPSAPQAESEEAPLYLNWADTVHYVGMETCRSCHREIYDNFTQTGMGQSFGEATPHKSAASFGPEHKVYDSDLDFWYYPYFRNDSLFVLEYRLKAEDTIHRREEYIQYIIGSGQHTNSHIINNNGYLYQAPITFYTQRGEWDLAPGFENGFNSRFNRQIAAECMTCHNGLPELAPGSENKYTKVATGIDCERCHGPGSLHVKEKLAGIIVDTTKEADRTIVNPKRLSVARQMDLCQRCHLQGVAVLQPEKNFADFRPGMKLADFMQVYLPQNAGEKDFLMAAHAERLRMSDCFKTQRLSCITCHDPHISVKQTPVEKFNATCASCHAQDQLCKEEEATRMAVQNNCVSCHMPSSESIDIPHVAVTDHYIRVLQKDAEPALPTILDLVSLTDTAAGDADLAKGYLRLYEGFLAERGILDKASSHLSKSSSKEPETQIQLQFLKEDFTAVIAIATESKEQQSWSAWTHYRVGESYYQQGLYARSLIHLEQAVNLMPLNLAFNSKMAVTLVRLQDVNRAKQVYHKIIEEDPKYYTALSNLGFLELQSGNIRLAESLYLKAIELAPDYVQGLMNLAGLYIYLKEKDKASLYLQRVLAIQPDHGTANQISKELGI
jgi:tetratricopeptide (TPR) repeat protein